MTVKTNSMFYECARLLRNTAYAVQYWRITSTDSAFVKTFKSKTNTCHNLKENQMKYFGEIGKKNSKGGKTITKM